MSEVEVTYIKTKADFDKILAEAGSKLVVIDFTASWCGPCKMIAPKFLEMKNENPDVGFYKVDVDDNSETSEACGISCMPTFQFYKNGTELKEAKLEGANEAAIKANIAKYK